jgi:hypothetical protein
MQDQSSTNKTPEPTPCFSNLASTRFGRWLQEEYAEKWKADPPRPVGLGLLGWSKLLLDHRVAALRATVRKRIEIYGDVAKELDDAEMLSRPCLERLREACLRTLECAKSDMNDGSRRRFNAAGDISPVAADAFRRRADHTFDAACTGLINAAIADLEAEAAAHRQRRSSKEPGNTGEPTSPPQPDHKADVIASAPTSRAAIVIPQTSKRRGRGFAANSEDHYKVVNAVAQIGSDWPSRLGEVCRGLHQSSAALPKRLRKAERFQSWDEVADEILGPGSCARRELVVKYVKYRISWVSRKQQGGEKSRESLAVTVQE